MQFYKSINKIFSYIVIITRKLFYFYLSSNSSIINCRLYQPVLTGGLGDILIHPNVKIGFPSSPFFFSGYCYLEARNLKSKIKIDEDTWINNNFCAISEYSSIEIGKRCYIGFNVTILDSDFHGLKVNERKYSYESNASSVFIGDDVFIGSSSLILKGVKVGNGSVIAAGSTVINDINSNCLYAGNPAKFIKFIE